MSTTYTLLATGYRPTISQLLFDPSKATLSIGSESKSPENASWLEPSLVKGREGVMYVNSEVFQGKVMSLKRREGEVEVSGEAETGGEEPAHICVLRDGSGIIVGNYTGGQIRLIPTSPDGSLSSSNKTYKPLTFPFPHSDKGPNPERQEKPHAHHVLEAEGGELYVCDLGSDRVWVVVRSEEEEEEGLKIKGWLQCPGGAGPRHSVMAPDGKHLYVITELHHSILIFSLSPSPSPNYPTHPLPNIEASVIPPSVPQTHQEYMDSAELLSNPAIPGILYASNRAELHIKELYAEHKGEQAGKDLPDLPDVGGDAVANILLNKTGDGLDGEKETAIKHVRTGCDGIRGMQISKDGKYVAVAGQKGGGVEIYQVGGKKGDEWKLAAKDEKLEQVTDFVWL